MTVIRKDGAEVTGSSGSDYAATTAGTYIVKIELAEDGSVRSDGTTEAKEYTFTVTEDPEEEEEP